MNDVEVAAPKLGRELGPNVVIKVDSRRKADDRHGYSSSNGSVFHV